MKIRDFTVSELVLLRETCNFTEDESQVFEYLARDYSVVKIAYLMNVSERTVSRISKRVKEKIRRCRSE